MKEGKYEVELTPKRINGKMIAPAVEENVLKASIERMLPEKFIFRHEKNDDGVMHWEWVKKKLIGQDTIVCEMGRGRMGGAEIGPDGEWMEVWYYTYRISLWYQSYAFLGIRQENNLLDKVCCATAKMIEERFDVSNLDDRSWMHGTYEINGRKIKI